MATKYVDIWSDTFLIHATEHIGKMTGMDRIIRQWFNFEHKTHCMLAI